MRPTVLVVEDFEILRDQLDEILTTAGYRVRLAKTLREALNKSHQERFDAVLLDVTCIPEPSNSEIGCSQARERNSSISCDEEWRLLEEAREGLQLVLDAYIDARISLAASAAEVSNQPVIEDITVSPDISDEQMSTWPYPNVSRGIDLEAEVCRYEIELTKRALKMTSGHQSRAAGLLKMNPTTLNSKIKKYRIRIA